MDHQQTIFLVHGVSLGASVEGGIVGLGWGLCLIHIWSFNPLAFGMVPTLSCVWYPLFKRVCVLSVENKPAGICFGGEIAVTFLTKWGRESWHQTRTQAAFSKFLFALAFSSFFRSYLVLASS